MFTAKSFQSHVQFPLMSLNWGIDILITQETGILIWKAPFPLDLWGWGFHEKSVFFLKIFSGGLAFDELI